MSAQSGPNEPRTGLVRQGLIVAIALVATFTLLFGATRLLDRTAESGPTSGPSTAAQASPGATAAAASPSATVARSPTPIPLVGPDGDPILIGAGDIAACDEFGDEATAALLDGLPGTVFTAGDNVYPSGTERRFRECYMPTWGRHLERTRAVPGNHEWQAGDLDGYFETFGDGSMGPDGDSWYSFDLGTWHIIMLDSSCHEVGGCEPDSPQGRWLAEDLAASEARCSLAIWHHPRFSSGRHGDNRNIQPLWDAVYEAGVDVVVNGHDHDYERFAPMDDDGDEDREAGIRQFVVGTGGKELREFDSDADHSEVRSSVTFGLLELTLREGRYDWRFIPTDGSFSDAGTARCH